MKKIKSIFINQRAQMRLGWLLVIAVGMYAVAAAGVYELYWYIYRTMMNIWCVTGENISRAPAAVQFLYSWSNVIVQIMQNALLAGLAVALARWSDADHEKKGSRSGFLKGAGIGAGCIALIWCVLMLLGSVRQGWRMSQPAFSINTLALLLTTFSSAFAEGCFFYGAVYAMLKKRLPIWAALSVTAIFKALMNGYLLSGAVVNSLLMALICCLLTESFGISAAIGFSFAWSWLDQAVFGFAGATAALYETYPVNRYWLSGGNAGILYGAVTTIVFLAVAGRMLGKSGWINFKRPDRKRKSPSS